MAHAHGHGGAWSRLAHLAERAEERIRPIAVQFVLAAIGWVAVVVYWVAIVDAGDPEREGEASVAARRWDSALEAACLLPLLAAYLHCAFGDPGTVRPGWEQHLSGDVEASAAPTVPNKPAPLTVDDARTLARRFADSLDGGLPAPSPVALAAAATMAAGGAGGGAPRSASRWRERLKPLQQCQKCDRPRPLRAHHCRVCNRCVLRMDHHCSWLGNCVGLYTQRSFLLVLLYLLLGALMSLYFLARRWFAAQPMAWPQALAALSCLPLLAFAVGFALLQLKIHGYLLFLNMTSIELAELSFLWDKAAFHGVAVNRTHAFDFGTWRNVCYIFGSQPLLWLLPLRSAIDTSTQSPPPPAHPWPGYTSAVNPSAVSDLEHMDMLVAEHVQHRLREAGLVRAPQRD